MKLLASVLSVAAADYACCPYDEYGVPESACVAQLTEKSPFSPNNAALVAQESHACKAWEANAGAANEDHKGAGVVHDWGSCGFQRHFPWYNNAASTNGVGLTTAGVANYQALGVGGGFSGAGNFGMLSLVKGPFSGATSGSKPVVGEVHLGGVCKLFVPVQKEHIRQVSIAGVHVNNARITGNTLRAFSSEMNAVVIGNTAYDGVGTQHSASFHAGTAYCFSVVNIAEFMTNRANAIANANVAGTDEVAANTGDNWNTDDQGKYYDANGVATSASFGTIWPGFDNTGTPSAGTAGQKESGQHKVNMGSNFDVVVHFDSAWCSAHWNIVDMQKTNDHGAGATDDSVSPSNLNGFISGAAGTYEGLQDAWDKRLPANTGSCGMCLDKTSVTRTPGGTLGSSVTGQCATNAVGGIANGADSSIGATAEFPYNGALGSCVDLNSVKHAGHRWPNAGAWAAFYSFVTCANADYMIYGKGTRTQRSITLKADPTDAAHLAETDPATVNPGSATGGDLTGDNNDNRMVIVGGWHQDYRHGNGACVRFNLRQVGEHIEYCADGDEQEFNAKNAGTLYKNPTGDTQAWSQNNPMRCTWNWNYNTLNSGTKDAEAWFDSVDPLHMQVWGATALDEEFIDEPAPGAPSAAAAGMQALYAAGSLTSTVTIQLLIEEKRGNRNNVAVAQAYVGPDTLDMDGPYATGGTVTSYAAGAASAPTNTETFDRANNGGSAALVTLACDNTGKYNGGASGHERMRDAFPDCFFGDEIHGQWTWNTANALQDIDQASQTSIWKFWAMLQ